MSKSELEKLRTGIAGLDQIARGGLPKGRATLVSGTAGSAKTVLASQYLAEGIIQFQESGIFATFEESPEDIRRNMSGFNWDIAKWESQNLWRFVDLSPSEEGDDYGITGDFDFGGVISRLKHAIEQTKATRVVLDSVNAVFTRFENEGIIRRELFRLARELKKMQVTTMVTTERISDYGETSKHGVEEFVADNVILLRNVLEHENRRRTLEILKFRGTEHQKGESPFTIVPKLGLALLPLSSRELTQKSSSRRISSGIKSLDQLCGGGFFQDSVILVSGATGTGKSLLTTHFVSGGAPEERSLLLGFEESSDQMLRNAQGWGMDFQPMIDAGRLKIICTYPESASLEDHLFIVQEAIEEFKPTRVAVDSLSALSRVSGDKSFRDFVLGLSSFLKEREIAGLFTSATASLLGGQSVTETHISTITDSIILLRYVEMFGEMLRGITVLKMRGSHHEKEICRFDVDSSGMHIAKAFKNITGILAGTPSYVDNKEVERIKGLFDE